MKEPAGPQASLTEAHVLLARGEEAEALRVLDEMVEREPQHLGALLLKAAVWLDRRDEASALDLCDRATKAWPRSAEAWNGMARCLHAMQRDKEALQTAQRARALLADGANHAQTGPVYLTLVWCLRELRRLKEALEVAEDGLARTPDAVLAQWASVVEEELAEAEKERC